MAEELAPTAVTEIAIDGANCPWCFNETIDELRAQPGVRSVTASISAQCLRVEHAGSDPAHLIETVRQHLRADAMFGAEHEMVNVEPRVADLRCTRHAHHGRSPS
jgi:copper chaperone CopZ